MQLLVVHGVLHLLGTIITPGREGADVAGAGRRAQAISAAITGPVLG